MSGPWWCVLPRDVVAIRGADAREYLQGQISQDVAGLAPGASAWSLVLAPQGKVDALFRLHALADGTFVADLDAGTGETLIERIERFRLRVDVTLEALDWTLAVVRGEGAARPDTPVGGVVAEVTWPGLEGFDVLGPDVVLPEGATVASIEQYEYTRIAAGWPVMGRELSEKTIPAEAGIVDLTVDFDKGCYTGQELVARIDSRGSNTPRRLCRLRADTSGVLAEGAEVSVDGSPVGTVTSAAAGRDGDPDVALAYLRRSVEPPTTVDVGGEPVSALGR